MAGVTLEVTQDAGALGGRVLPTGSVRALVHGSIARLPGYDEGAWWVQDAAAALPAVGSTRTFRVLKSLAGGTDSSAFRTDTAVLRTHIANLRRKVGSQHIRTDPGVGYRFAG